MYHKILFLASARQGAFYAPQNIGTGINHDYRFALLVTTK